MEVTDIAELREAKLKRQVPARRKPADFLKSETLTAPSTTEDGIRL